MRSKILNLVYYPENIWVTKYRFDDANRAVEIYFIVPKDVQYTRIEMHYVPGECHFRCLNQVSYVLADRLIRKKLIDINLSSKEFHEAAKNLRINLRDLYIKFLNHAEKGKSFKMRLTLLNYKQVSRISDYFLLSFTGKEWILNTEMSFVFASNGGGVK